MITAEQRAANEAAWEDARGLARLAQSRYREAVQRGADPRNAVVRTRSGHGRAVVRGGYVEDGVRMHHVAWGTHTTDPRDFLSSVEID